jgi:hypothetical protein
MAPVWTAAAATPELELDFAAAVAELEIAVLCTIPEVKGAVDTELAPEKATLVVPGFGAAEVLLGLSTLSITCTTPLATKTSGVITFALFTYTFPFSMVMVTFSPFTVVNVVFVKVVLYPTVPFTTWYVKMLSNCAVERFPSAEPIALNAALEGAKIVTSLRSSTVVTRLALVRAPAREVRFAATAVAESDSGIVRTRSMIWITPPVKLTLAVVTVLTESKPVIISTLLPFNLASTLCPPVTFAYEVLVNRVGINCEVLVNALAG